MQYFAMESPRDDTIKETDSKTKGSLIESTQKPTPPPPNSVEGYHFVHVSVLIMPLLLFPFLSTHVGIQLRYRQIWYQSIEVQE